MQVRQEPSPRLVMGVRYVIAGGGTFSGNLTDSGHVERIPKCSSWNTVNHTNCGRCCTSPECSWSRSRDYNCWAPVLEQAVLGKREYFSVTDDEMIQNAHINQREGIL